MQMIYFRKKKHLRIGGRVIQFYPPDRMLTAWMDFLQIRTILFAKEKKKMFREEVEWSMEDIRQPMTQAVVNDSVLSLVAVRPYGGGPSPPLTTWIPTEGGAHG